MPKMKLIAGPCVIESEDHCRMMAEELKAITDKFDVDWYFKASFDKANRTSIDSFRGPGLHKGIRILNDIKQDLGIKITTDFHTVAEIISGAYTVDVVQIPAFLCRQTDLLVAAGEMGKIVNIKKGQSVGLDAIFEAYHKVGSVMWVTERGTSYGNDIHIDFSHIKTLSTEFGTIVDCTHPSHTWTWGSDSVLLAKLGIQAGAFGVFMEVHDDPENAKCDGDKSVKLSDFEGILKELTSLWDFIHK